MREAKFTPGPWATDPAEPHLVWAGSDHPQVVAEAWIDWENRVPTRANAALIAAAPEMYALLNELIDIEGPQPGNVEWARRVRSTIAKAEGREG